MTQYLRPILQSDPAKPQDALALGQGWTWFTHVDVLSREALPERVHVRDVDPARLDVFTSARASLAGLDMASPNVMGILNTTPDSFSDGGKFNTSDAAIARALAMVDAGADIIDIGGESTRPGADYVEIDDEIARTAPIIQAISDQIQTPISIDTRKAAVAKAAVSAGASIINDVYAFTHDPALADVAAQSGTPVCLMHAQGDPKIMQNNPVYDHVVLDVYDFLSERIEFALQAGITRDKISIDPGIGFGKTLEHNIELLKNLSVFHGLGVPILLGASRKRFIGTLSGEEQADKRVAGTIAVTLHGLAQGVQVHRVHDISEINQAIAVQSAIFGKTYE